MAFTDKYVIEAFAAEPNNKQKIIVSTDAFAVGEMLEKLLNKLEQLRIYFLR